MEIQDGRCPEGAQCYAMDNLNVKVHIENIGYKRMSYIGNGLPKSIDVYGKSLIIEDIDYGTGKNIGKTEFFKVAFKIK